MSTILGPHIVALLVGCLEPWQDVVSKDLLVDISTHLFSKLEEERGHFFPVGGHDTQDLDYECCWILCNFSLEVVNDIPIPFFVNPTAARLPLDAVAHVYGLLDIVDSAQGYPDFFWK